MKLRGTIAVAMIAGFWPVLADDVNPQEQLLIYELNRARNNPVRYQTEHSGIVTADLSSVAAQMPLALNADLDASARFRADEMVTNNYCAYQSAVTGLWPNQIARNFGYQLPASYPDTNNYIEAVHCEFGPTTFANTLAEDSLASLIEDEGNSTLGNRIQLLAIDPFFQANREIGTGISTVATTITGHAGISARIAIETAQVNASDLFLTGVVYADANGNRRYDLNEGLGNVTIGNGVTSVVSRAAGGWSIPVTSGVYTLMASGGTFSGVATAQVNVVNANVEIDFASGNSAGEVDFTNQVVAPPVHDLAVVKLKAPKKIALSATTTSKVGKFSVSIQNRSPHNEVIPDLPTLSNLVSVSVQSLSNCPSFFATPLPPKAPFPITLLPKKKLTIAFTGNFSCANDPLATSSTAAHNDYRNVAHVNHAALPGGIADTHTADDDCPHAPLPGGVDPNPDGKIKDGGCGGKNPDGSLGADVFTDVVVK
jgi:hypothetical protein